MNEELKPEPSSYESRQATRNAEYRREYETWFNSLPAADKQLLKQKGLHHALIDYHASESSKDVCDRNFPTYEPAFEIYPPTESDKRMWELVERISILFMDAQNPRLEAHVLSFASGLSTQMGISGTEIAAKFGLSRAAFSKRCIQLKNKLGLPPSRAMKSEHACRTYAVTNGARRCK